MNNSPPPIQRLPRTLVRAKRNELTNAAVKVLAGKLPADLRGHLFVNTACGSAANEPPLPPSEVTTILNGDGYIQRFDFGDDGTVKLTTRLAKTECFWADAGCEKDPAFKRFPWRFSDHGILRFSPRLGQRNMVNTAFLAFDQPGEATRMITCWDAGRPWEFDPTTLELVTPVGERTEWHPEGLKHQPFAGVFTTAHPTWDERTGEGFFVNYGKGIDALMGTVPVVDAITTAATTAAFQTQRVLSALRFDKTADGMSKLWRALGRARTEAEAHLPAFIDGVMPERFTYLVRWDGKGELERWLLTNQFGVALAIRESVHQLCVTRNWIILMDTGFKISLGSLMDQPIHGVPQLEQIIRGLVTRPMESELTFYFVPRSALVNGGSKISDGDEVDRRLAVQQMTIPAGAVHFVADYADADDLLTLHVAHAAATDVSEWVRPYDRQTWANRAMSPPDIAGMMALGAWDINRVAKYVIHAPTTTLRKAQVLASDPETWAIGLYAGRNQCTAGPLPEKITDLYWFSIGCFPELNTRFVRDTYINFPGRMQSMAALQTAQLSGGRPASLFRVHTATMEIADSYLFDFGVALSSPQFVPRHGGKGGPTDGYLTAVVFTQDNNELWIWDAAKLSKGPVCKLGCDNWIVGFTMHSAWLPHIAPRTSEYAVDVHQELRDMAAGDPKLAELLEKWVAPNLQTRKATVSAARRSQKTLRRQKINFQ